MILRRITEHVKAQNWFAVGLDFLIVVLGVWLGLQAQQWTAEAARRSAEERYLSRLHVDIEGLISLRAAYDSTRPRNVLLLEAIMERLNGNPDALAALFTEIAPDSTDDQRDAALCSMLVYSSALTVPPADLPTATELLTAGRVNDLASQEIRAALLAYQQEASRAQELTLALQMSVRELGRAYPDLFELTYANVTDEESGGSFVEARCELELMRQSRARAQGLVDSTGRLIELIRAGDTPRDEEAVREMLRNALHYNAPIAPPTTFSEALASGRIGKIRDASLRRVLNEYQISTEWWGTVSGASAIQNDPDSHLLQSITMSADQQSWEEAQYRVLSFDWDRVRQAERELGVIQRLQSFQTEAYRLERVAVRNVLLALENTE